MSESELLREFRAKREEFLKHLEDGSLKIKDRRGRSDRAGERLFDWFEKWLAGEIEIKKPKKTEPAMPLDQFLNEVTVETARMLLADDQKLENILNGPLNNGSHAWKCYSKNWKSLYVFEDSEVFYRIGKTTPRKGKNQGQELIVIELVLDGMKKQAFIPLLDYVGEIEAKIGAPLEREQPRAEATGKYRFKLFVPYAHAHDGEVEVVAERLYEFVGATRPLLHKFGVN